MDYLGKKIGKYILTRYIGGGGMSSVYEGEHISIKNLKAAIKILNPILASNPNICQRFINEANILAKLRHPYIVNVIDFEQSENILAIIMELLEGVSLSSYIERKGALSAKEAVELMVKILDAFSYAHSNDIIHRDIKPSNIVILNNGNPKVLDFGIAKIIGGEGELTQTGIQMGTLAYMSPEQLTDTKNVDLRTDIYSLGVTLYYMLSGKSAYDHSTQNTYKIIKAIVELPFPKLTINKEFQPIIDKATAKLPQDRYQSCEEFKKALLEHTKEQVISLKDETEKNDQKTQITIQKKEKDIGASKKDDEIIDKQSFNESKTLKIEQLNQITQKADKSKNKIKKLISIIVILMIVFLGIMIFKPQREKTEVVNGVPIELVKIKGGTFQMGSNDGDSDERPVHSVTVADFYMSKYEITVAQFEAFVKETGYETQDEKDGYGYVYDGSWREVAGINWRHDVAGNLQTDKRHPVIRVSWEDAVAYCQWLSRKTGKQYRLPTEAEWEYAAGNGSKHTKYSWGNSNPTGRNGGNVADETTKEKFSDRTIFNGYYDNYVYTAPVGQFNPNKFGLYDMTGNVWEWCSDWYSDTYYSNSADINPRGPSSGSDRVIRGGSWLNSPYVCRVVTRCYAPPSVSNGIIGFRVCRKD